jgi:peroxin-3
MAAGPSPAGLRRLLDETADLIESPSFSHVLTLILDAAFEALVDKKLATDAFGLPSQSPFPPPESMGLRHSKLILLPKILSVLTRQAHVIGSTVPNEYLQEMETVRALESFAAVVYSSNWENEIRDEDIMGSAVDISKGEVESQLLQPLDKGKQTAVSESIVMVDSPGGFEDAWEKATQKSS